MTDLLTPWANDLAELIGFDRALLLVETYGGGSVYAPATLREDHPLVILLGVEAAEKFARHFGGERVPIPRCAERLRRIRNRAIRAKNAAGTSALRLAYEYRLTERQVWRILGETDPADDRQTDLFRRKPD